MARNNWVLFVPSAAEPSFIIEAGAINLKDVPNTPPKLTGSQ